MNPLAKLTTPDGQRILRHYEDQSFMFDGLRKSYERTTAAIAEYFAAFIDAELRTVTYEYVIERARTATR